MLRQEIGYFDVSATSGRLLQGLNEDCITIQLAVGDKVAMTLFNLSTFCVGITIGKGRSTVAAAAVPACSAWRRSNLTAPLKGACPPTKQQQQRQQWLPSGWPTRLPLLQPASPLSHKHPTHARLQRLCAAGA